MADRATEKLTWEQLAELEVGTILLDEFDEGVRFIIMRGPSHLCAYVGVPLDHPLAGYEYEDLPISAHGGLTFSAEGGQKHWPKGYWWYGWDYGHCDDDAFYNKPGNPFYSGMGKKRWLVKDVRDDSWEALFDIKKLMRLAEKIINKERSKPCAD